MKTGVSTHRDSCVINCRGPPKMKSQSQMSIGHSKMAAKLPVLAVLDLSGVWRPF